MQVEPSEPGLADLDLLLAAWQQVETSRLQRRDQAAASDAFFALLATPAWNATGYDPDIAARRVAEPERLRDLPLATLRLLLTWCLRGERFCGGHHDRLLDDGTLAALMARLRQLRDVMADERQRAPLAKVAYAALNARQKENHNFQKVSALLADYGFVTLRLNDDWQGADFIARHIDGDTFLKVQLKSRLTIARKYRGRQLHVCFPHHEAWYLYPHDALLEHLLASSNVGNTHSWRLDGLYTQHSINRGLLQHMQRWRL